jgi:hypothetical protein
MVDLEYIWLTVSIVVVVLLVTVLEMIFYLKIETSLVWMLKLGVLTTSDLK